MVRHVIIWDFIDELREDAKQAAAQRIRTELEALKDSISGIIDIKVLIQPLATSNGSIMLDSTFENEAALADYAVHPLHLKVKDYITTVVKSRKCFDYTL